MQFPSSKRRKSTRVTGDRDPDLYPHTLQFYSKPPQDTITLSEFEEFAIERLKVLKAIEAFSIKLQTQEGGAELKGKDERAAAFEVELRNLNHKEHLLILTAILKKHDAIESQEDVNRVYDAKRADHISHFILRLAYCRSEDLRRWFIQQEVDLFRWRYERESAGSKARFLQLCNLQYVPINDEEKNRLQSYLISGTIALTSMNFGDKVFYKVPFTDALDLVKHRRVFVSNGFAYIPDHDLNSLVVTEFRTHLSRFLAVTARALPTLEEDFRLMPMLGGLSRRYLGEDYGSRKTSATGAITAVMIDGLSKTSFPLCMKNLHQKLKEEHHLRHNGRLQYSLFLKGIGVSLEEAMRFWRTEFTKKTDIDADKFDKSYAYNFRHSYGKEGKRANYTPYSCMKIIMSNQPGPGDHHGCPFRHTSPDMLKQQLLQLRLSPMSVEGIMEKVRTQNYQIACGRYFDAVHKVDRCEGIEHPNQYFDESQKILNPGEDGRGSNTPTTPATPRYKQFAQRTPQSQTTPRSQNTPNSRLTAKQHKVDEFDPQEMEKVLQAMDEME